LLILKEEGAEAAFESQMRGQNTTYVLEEMMQGSRMSLPPLQLF
jgi:hypothetical protein